MDAIIENGIKVLAGKIVSSVSADEALKYTQAALNLAHAAQVIQQAARTN